MDMLTANTGLLVSTLLLAAAAAVLLILGVAMSRAGLSLRPIVWFGGIFLLIVGPQFAVHLYRALAPPGSGSGPGSVAGPYAWDTAIEPPESAAALVAILGPPAQDAMVSDVAPLFAAAGAPARWARFAVTPGAGAGAGTAIVAAYDTHAGAARGVAAWLSASGLAPDAAGTALTGFSGSRPASDRYYARAIGCYAVVWTAADASALRAFVAASAAPPRTVDGIRFERSDTVIETAPFGLTWPATMAILLAYTLLVSAAFIKGAAWASALPAHAVPPASATDLRARLLALGHTDAPFNVRPGDAADEVVVEWRYADARWIDHARAHATRRTHRLVLRLDAGGDAVHVREYSAAFDASAGADAARLQWQFTAGINFYQHEHQRVLGVQLDPAGRPTGAHSSGWTFDLQALKSPLHEIVRRAGWGWRPVLWDAPHGVRWLFS